MKETDKGSISPPQYPDYPQYPPQYPGYPYQYPYPPPKKDNTIIIIIVVLVIIFIIIPIIIAGIFYLWASSISEPDSSYVVTIVASLEQGDGNIDSGCLFVLTKGSGDSVKLADYTFRVGESGGPKFILRWPEEGNSTAYSTDSQIRSDDDKWWDTAEQIGFDAPAGLTGIGDGDEIEVCIINEASGDIVYINSFTYRE